MVKDAYVTRSNRMIFKDLIKRGVSAIVLMSMLCAIPNSVFALEKNVIPDPCTETAKVAEIKAAKMALEQRKVVINTLTNELSFIARETSCVDTMLRFDFTLTAGFMSLTNIIGTAVKEAFKAALNNACNAVHTWVVNEVTGSINKSIGFSGIPGLDNLGSIYVGFGRYGRVGDSGPDYDPITYKKATTGAQNKQQPELPGVAAKPAPGVVEKIRNLNVF